MDDTKTYPIATEAQCVDSFIANLQNYNSFRIKFDSFLMGTHSLSEAVTLFSIKRQYSKSIEYHITFELSDNKELSPELVSQIKSFKVHLIKNNEKYDGMPSLYVENLVMDDSTMTLDVQKNNMLVFTGVFKSLRKGTPHHSV